MPPKSSHKVSKKITVRKTTVKKATVKKAAPKSEKKVPLHDSKEDAQEVAEIKRRRDALIARDPNNPKWVESAHLACIGLYRCYREIDHSKCLKAIHDKLDRLEKK